MKTVYALSAAMTLAACGQSHNHEALDDGGSIDGGIVIPPLDASAARDGALDASRSFGECRTEGCSIAWDEQGEYPEAVQSHASFVVERNGISRLFVMGGAYATRQGYEVTPSIRSIRIADDGSLQGEWTAEASFLGGYAGMAFTQNEHGAYVIGGYITRAPDVSVSTAALFPYTIIMRFSEDAHFADRIVCDAELSAPMFYASAVSLGDHVYVIGGARDSNAVSSVLAGEMQSDGCINAWLDSAPLPVPLYNASALVHQDKIYVIGGVTGTESNVETLDSVYESQFDEDGALSGWTLVATLPRVGFSMLSASHDGALWIIGGGALEGRALTLSDQVLRMSTSEGAPATFTEHDDALLLERVSTHATQHGNHLYIVGGGVSANDTRANVLVGTFR